MLSMASPASAQRVRSDVDTTSITVGDRLGLTVEVTHDATASVQWPDSLDLSPFELLSVDVGSPTSNDAGTTSTARYTLTAFELGELEIPSFDVTIMASDGTATTVPTDRFGIEVLSVGADQGGDIREIRGPLSIPVAVIRVLLWALGLMALGAALYALARRYRRRGGGEPAPDPGPPPRPAHELALEALQRLEASPMLARGQIKEYHVELSDILRRYVEACYRVPAMEMTTREIEERLRRVDVDGSFGEGLRRILHQCDLAKFAKARPDAERSFEALRSARELVTSSAAAAGSSATAAVDPDPGGAADTDGVPRGEVMVATTQADSAEGRLQAAHRSPGDSEEADGSRRGGSKEEAS
jgi:hypothetical protein